VASQFQNRLIGTIIVVAVGVIFLPDLFSGKTADEGTFSSIPLQPVFTRDSTQKNVLSDKSMALTPSLAKNTKGEKTETSFGSLSNTPTQLTVHDKTVAPITADMATAKLVKPIVKTATDVSSKPKLDAVANGTKTTTTDPKATVKSPFDVLKGGWSIQLGTFRNTKNAMELVTTLEKAGYPAHTIPSIPTSGQLTKVMIGPNLSKAVLENDIAPLAKLTGLTGKLVTFNALNP
jgi:DedD protein